MGSIIYGSEHSLTETDGSSITMTRAAAQTCRETMRGRGRRGQREVRIVCIEWGTRLTNLAVSAT